MPWIRAYQLNNPHPEKVSISGWHANIPDTGEEPYFDRLTRYLRNELDPRKLEKLNREAATLNATRQHLYLLVASTGKWGALLPTNPSYFSWGTFTPPDWNVTDLWLDAGNQLIYHWTTEEGWSFHRL